MKEEGEEVDEMRQAIIDNKILSTSTDDEWISSLVDEFHPMRRLSSRYQWRRAREGSDRRVDRWARDDLLGESNPTTSFDDRR